MSLRLTTQVAGSIYLWPYICDAMEDGGLLTDSR